jgi:hypothetical protein
MKNPTIEYHLRFARQVLSNAKASKAIKEAMDLFGYDDEKMQEGENLYETANQLYIDQIRESGEKIGATQDVRDAYEQASKVYMVHVTLARIAFRNSRDLYVALQLNGSRQKSYDKWLGQAEAFYSIALDKPEVQRGMALMKIDRKKLKEGQDLINKFRQTLHQRGLETGDAQRATLMRDEAVQEMNQWISDYLTISRIALDENPQELEKLGVVV